MLHSSVRFYCVLFDAQNSASWPYNLFLFSSFFNSLMADGGGGGWMPSPTDFSNFSLEWEEPLLQTKFLAVGSSLRHLSMKNFSDWTYRLGSKIRQRGVREKSHDKSQRHIDDIKYKPK